MPKEDLTEIKNVKTDEVSLVDKGANKKKRFPIYKQESPMNEDIIKAVLETQVDEETGIDEFIKKSELDETGAQVVKGALRLLAGFKDKLPTETLSELAKVAGYEEPVVKAKEEEEIPPKKKNEKEMEEDEEEELKMKKSLEELPEEVRKEFEAIHKAQDDKISELTKANEVFAKQLKEERDRRETEEWVAKCKEHLAALPGKTAQEHGESFKKMADADPELAKEQFAVLKAAADAVKEGNLYKELGGRGEDTTGSVMTKINKAANELRKSDSNLSKEQAFMKALENDPKLYAEYMADNPAQSGRIN
jgi:hypothetical protein